MRKWVRRVGQGALALGLLLCALVAWAWKSDIPLDELKSRWATGASRFVEIDGMSVHYRDEGSGLPILLLHGTGSSLHTWDGWADALSSSHRVVRLDLPGFGLTGPEPRADYRIDTYVEFVDHFAARLGLGHFALAGNSLGGEIAWRFAVAHPSELTELVLVDAGGYPRTTKRPLVFRIGGMPILSELMGHLDPRMLVERTTRQCYGDPTRVTSELVERYYELSLRAGNRAAFGARTSLPFDDRTSELRGLHVRTLILWGDRDALIPSSNARRFAADIQGATVHTYGDLGHVPMEEDGPRTAADVRAFLEKP
ncbi:MAG: alpha/beta fold hydrolase [Polyangiaceae bacterium]